VCHDDRRYNSSGQWAVYDSSAHEAKRIGSSFVLSVKLIPLSSMRFTPMVIVFKGSPGLWATALLAGMLAVSCPAGEVGDYLTKDGQLKETVRVRIGGKDFLAPADEVWIIGPSGDWSWEFTDSNGKLSSKQVAALAQHLATQDFKTLPKTQGYQPKDADSGYRYVVIAFGKQEATFYAKSGESPSDYVPKPGDPKAAAWSRFIALELVLADLLKMSEVRAEYGIDSGRGSAK
jgi:hypothetical protein